jgi:hypothetical protein
MTADAATLLDAARRHVRLDVLRNARGRGGTDDRVATSDVGGLRVGFEHVDTIITDLRGQSDAVTLRISVVDDPAPVRDAVAARGETEDYMAAVARAGMAADYLFDGKRILPSGQRAADEHTVFVAHLASGVGALFFDEWIERVSRVLGPDLGGPGSRALMISVSHARGRYPFPV